MRRLPALLLLVVSLGACAHRRVEPVPTASLPAAAPVTVATAPVQQPQSRPETTAVAPVRLSAADSQAGNAALSFDRRATRDSLADAALLMALGDTAALSRLPDLSLDVVPALDLNVTAFASQPRVQYWVDYFSGLGHDRFQIWLDRMPRYESFIRDRLTENRLPGDLIYLALIESGFSSSAVSSASAVGMWQFMAPTGKGYGLQVDAWRDERRDPVRATDAAARHLRDLTDRFGSYYLAAAAYNAGAGKVGRGLTRMGAATDSDAPDDEPDLTSGDAFFSLADTRLIMQETKDYVPKLIAATLIAKTPQNYGFDPAAPGTPFSLDSVLVDGGTGLDLIARLADTTLDALRELNPHLLRLVAPPTLASYPVRVPAGSAERVAERYAAVRPEDRLALAPYKVKAGETVASIAKATGANAEEIRTVNRAARAGKLATGTVLYIPSTTIPMALLRDVGASTVTMTHLVKSGETLSGIARRYGVTVTALRTSNRLSSKAKIRIGQRLAVPVRGSSAAVINASLKTTRPATRSSATVAAKTSSKSGASSKAMPASGAKIHTVKSGETISGIAARYGVNQARLASLNGLGSKRKIVVGQRLKIPA